MARYDQRQIAIEKEHAPEILRHLGLAATLAATAYEDLHAASRLDAASSRRIARAAQEARAAHAAAAAENERETWDSDAVSRYVAALVNASVALETITNIVLADPDIAATHADVGTRLQSAAASADHPITITLTEREVRVVVAAWTLAFRTTADRSPAYRLAIAQTQHVRLPLGPVTALTATRSGEGLIVDDGRDHRGETFAAPGIALWKFRVDAKGPRQLTLSVPARSGMADPFAAVRHGLTGWDLRAWIAMFSLPPHDSRGGVFRLDPRSFLLDVLGLKPEHTTSKGKRYTRAPRDAERRLDATLDRLASVLFYGYGDLEWDPPQHLVTQHEVTHKPTGTRERVYVHAPFAWGQVATAFVQFPRSALRLDADLADTAIGVATLLRNHVNVGAQWVTTGAVQLPLARIARDVGLPVGTGLARDGLSYWQKARDTISRVVASGGFGRLHVGVGDHGEQLLTVEPSPLLATVYEPLRRRRVQRVEQSELAAIVAEEVTKALPEKRRPGRPRKLP